MKLEDQVVSLELAKRLKELGVKQGGYFWWRCYPAGVGQMEPWCDVNNCKHGQANEHYSAFTVAELGEMLPYRIFTNRGASSMGFCVYVCRDRRGKYPIQLDTTEANARAKMLIHLIEQGVGKP